MPGGGSLSERRLDYFPSGGTSAVNGFNGTDANKLAKTLRHIANYDVGNVQWQWPTLQIAQAILLLRERGYDAAPSPPIPVPEGTPHGGTLTTPPTAYGNFKNSVNIRNGCRDTSVLFFLHSKAAYATYKFTNQVNTDPVCGGGADLFMKVWAGYGFNQ
jgi:hypothetical protein